MPGHHTTYHSNRLKKLQHPRSSFFHRLSSRRPGFFSVIVRLSEALADNLIFQLLESGSVSFFPMQSKVVKYGSQKAKPENDEVENRESRAASAL
jgi:hypothetical protein